VQGEQAAMAAAGGAKACAVPAPPHRLQREAAGDDTMISALNIKRLKKIEIKLICSRI
jgi:hypothetical protein